MGGGTLTPLLLCAHVSVYSYTGEIYVHGFGNVISTNKVTIKLWLGLRPQQCGTYDFITDEIQFTLLWLCPNFSGLITKLALLKIK